MTMETKNTMIWRHLLLVKDQNPFRRFIFRQRRQIIGLQEMFNLLTYLLIYLLNYSMVQSPSWEANRFAASQEIPRISRNPKVHYRSQVSTTCPYPEPARSSPYTHIPPPGDPS